MADQMQILFRTSPEMKKRVLYHFGRFSSVTAMATHDGAHVTVHDADTHRHKFFLDEAHKASNWPGVENVKISIQNIG